MLRHFYPRFSRWLSTCSQPFTVNELIKQTAPLDVHLNVSWLLKNWLFLKSLLDGYPLTNYIPLIQFQGWVQRSQKRGKVIFLHISDGLTPDTVQVVVSKDICASVPIGSAVSVYGHWKASAGSQQHMELVADKCKVEAFDVNARYDDLSPDQLRKNLHLRSRSSSFAALLRIRSRLILEIHKFFMERNYIHIDAPIITANDCEGAGETFSVAFYSHYIYIYYVTDRAMIIEAYLEFSLTIFISGISRVYTIGGGFRAEKQQSSNHLSEFRMLEVELAFCKVNICTITEDFVRHCILLVLEDISISRDFKTLGAFSSENHMRTLKSILTCSNIFPRLRYDEAVAILVKKKQNMTGNGLNKQNELFLVDYCKSPVFITNFPIHQKPFYMKHTADGQKTESFDLLCPIVGELAGGSVREPSADVLRLQGANIDWLVFTSFVFICLKNTYFVKVLGWTLSWQAYICGIWYWIRASFTSFVRSQKYQRYDSISSMV
uniref:AA_TRNA_LIGASE_II domain-containing protein n=1 Tax=Heterorhabditis bacteriophora TaxID=37862 RepID=A0A1I7WC15_HETBA